MEISREYAKNWEKGGFSMGRRVMSELIFKKKFISLNRIVWYEMRDMSYHYVDYQTNVLQL